MKINLETGIKPSQNSETAMPTVEDLAMPSPEGSIESTADWRSLREQAPSQATKLVESKLGKTVENASLIDRAATIALLLQDPSVRGDKRGDYTNRFLVEALSKMLEKAEKESGSVSPRPHETAGIPA